MHNLWLVSETTAWVAQRIKQAREGLKLSQTELAERLGRTQTAVSYWESARRTPGLDDLVDLAAALGKDVSYFFPSQPEPIRAILRATAETLDYEELNESLQTLLDDAELLPAPERDIDVGAREPAKAAREMLEKAGVTAPPVDVEAIARRCGVKILEHNFGDALSGVLIASDEGPVIGVNQGHGHNRQRFTIAHELGHHLLAHHERFHIDLGPDAEHGHPPGYDWQSERAANDFAAELLMPAVLVTQAFAKHPSVPALASQFEVSTLAMGYRLVNLGLR